MCILTVFIDKNVKSLRIMKEERKLIIFHVLRDYCLSNK